MGSRNNFFDYDLGVLQIFINKEHDFYTKFLALACKEDTEIQSFELFIASLVKTIYDLQVKNNDIMDILMDKINKRLKSYLKSNG